MIEIEIKVNLYSLADQATFFEWLDRVQCVETYAGSRPYLRITVNRSELRKDSVEELLDLFTRYRIPKYYLLPLNPDDDSGEPYVSRADFWAGPHWDVVSPDGSYINVYPLRPRL